MIIARFQKAPGERLDFTIDWTLPGTDTVASSSWAITTTGTMLLGSGAYAPTFTASTTTVWVTGGTVGEAAVLTVTATTTEGRILQRTIEVNVA